MDQFSIKEPICYIAIPCFNEEKVLPLCATAFLQKIQQLETQQQISTSSRILFVDDGSSDATWKEIVKLHEKFPCVVGLKFAANRGHQNALLAGLLYSKDKADIVISFDVDLQDDIQVIDSFIEKYKQGAQIVYGVRKDRRSDSFFKRTTAQIFYKLMQQMGVKLVYNHADCRLMSKTALEALASYPEKNLFLRGLIVNLGFKTDTAYYVRHERMAGESKYPLRKMLNFAWEGLTSFSVVPIRLISLLGLLIVGSSLLLFIYLLACKIFGSYIPDNVCLIGSIFFMGGVQLLSIGVIGEYIGKTYLETKQRPRYIIEQILE